MNKASVVVGIVVVVVIVLLSAGAFVLMSPDLVNNLFGAKTTTPTTPLVPTPQPEENSNLQPANPVSLTPISSNQISLVISNPVDKAVVVTPNVKLTGTTAPSADVSVNEIDLKANAKGEFSTNLTLYEGENPIVIIAVDQDGNVSEQEITVTYQIPE